MEQATWYAPGSPRLWDAMRFAWEMGERICAPRFPTGVYKHRTIEDANRQREAWDESNFRRFQQSRGR